MYGNGWSAKALLYDGIYRYFVTIFQSGVFLKNIIIYHAFQYLSLIFPSGGILYPSIIGIHAYQCIIYNNVIKNSIVRTTTMTCNYELLSGNTEATRLHTAKCIDC